MSHSTVVPVVEASQVGEARRAAARASAAAGLGEAAAGKVAIVTTELANNLHRYATGGRILLRVIAGPAGRGVEVLSVDAGPGMPDPDRCLQDGFSTGGTPGNGLGAVKRLSAEFDVFSASPGGTVILSRVWDAGGLPKTNGRAAAWGAVALPAPGEEVCGDAWRSAERDGGFSLAIADGLGHGPLAKEAADAVCLAYDADAFAGPTRVLEAAHRAASGSRGAAVAVAELDSASGVLRYAGVGNIAGTLLSPGGSRGLFTHNGIVGVQMRKVQGFEYPWPHNGLLVMHSDGLQSRWTLDPYPGLYARHPAVVAAVLARDFTRGRDDVTVVAVRLQA
jgi:anti-sigma regulatory factor (Ser/Thr protein kinase)